MKANTISEEILGAIAAILNERSPDLLPIVKQLIEDNDAAPSSGALGQSVHGVLTGSVPFMDGERILNVLKEYENIHGEQATVNGRQLNFIVLEWQKFSTPRDGRQPL